MRDKLQLTTYSRDIILLYNVVTVWLRKHLASLVPLLVNLQTDVWLKLTVEFCLLGYRARYCCSTTKPTCSHSPIFVSRKSTTKRRANWNQYRRLRVCRPEVPSHAPQSPRCATDCVNLLGLKYVAQTSVSECCENKTCKVDFRSSSVDVLHF